MKRVVPMVALTGLLTLGVGWAVAAPAAAGTPPEVFHDKIDLSLKNIDQCGFTVNSIVKGTSTFKVTVDASGTQSFQHTAHVVSTLTNVANGKVVHVDSAGRDAWSDGGVENPDGTFTFTDTLAGRDIRIYTSHSSVLMKDVGFLAIVETVDSEGNLISQELLEHGPHQFAGDFDAMCDVIADAIGPEQGPG
ncbi:hypothetical protein [Microbacterium sp. P5_E9]